MSCFFVRVKRGALIPEGKKSLFQAKSDTKKENRKKEKKGSLFKTLLN